MLDAMLKAGVDNSSVHCARLQAEGYTGSQSIRMYLYPVRTISFDGFVNYEGREFGVPYSYHGTQARIMRYGTIIYTYIRISEAVAAFCMDAIVVILEIRHRNIFSL